MSTQVRLAVLCSFNLELLPRYLKPALLKEHLDGELYLSRYGQYRQDILGGGSQLYTFSPDVIILFIDGQDWLAELCEGPFDFSPEQRAAYGEQAFQDLEALVRVIRERLPETMLFVHTLYAPPLNSLKLLEFNTTAGIRDVFGTFNERLRSLGRKNKGVYVLDYESLVGIHGYKMWFDERMWALARMRLSEGGMRFLAEYYANVLKALKFGPRKVLVLDCDDTLWGGEIGSEGVNGIELGMDGIGFSFWEFQREILNLYKRGVLLAINSKNNWDDAVEAIDLHPAMFLRRDHFASIKINWEDKVTNLREISKELSLALDSFVFVDNNPVECDWVRSQLPEVEVIQLPEDPAAYRETLLQTNAFAALSLTSEDRERGARYHAQAGRESLRKAAPTLEAFYAELKMRAVIEPATVHTVARIAQLTQRTNQFNLTKRAYTESEIELLIQSKHWRVFGLSLTDKCGDNGLVGVAILEYQGDVVHINNFLLSCRVMGRTLETALLYVLGEHARRRGGRYLLGEYRPTKKNMPVRSFYAGHGFRSLDGDGNIWQLDLEKDALACPEYIDVEFRG